MSGQKGRVCPSSTEETLHKTAHHGACMGLVHTQELSRDSEREKREREGICVEKERQNLEPLRAEKEWRLVQHELEATESI